MTFTRYTFGADPNGEFAPGGLLHGYDGDCLDADDYRPDGPIAVALQEQHGVSFADDDELIAGRLANGAIAVLGLTVEGHPFYVTPEAP
jgi:hypothetical protein